MKFPRRLSGAGRVLSTRISKGGQLTVPADIRRRWGTTRVVLEDAGDRLIVRPIPEDPIGAVIGSLDFGGLTSDEMRDEDRREEEEIEERKRGTGRT